MILTLLLAAASAGTLDTQIGVDGRQSYVFEGTPTTIRYLASALGSPTVLVGSLDGFSRDAVCPPPSVDAPCLDLVPPIHVLDVVRGTAGQPTVDLELPAVPFVGEVWLQAAASSRHRDAASRVLRVHVLDPLGDVDGDGVSSLDEHSVYGSNPLQPDTDLDGLTDGEEVAHGTDALDPDSDGDGLRDGEEVHVHGTDPLAVDTDGGGLDDHAEVLSGRDPLDASDDPSPTPGDRDGDGLSDNDELLIHGTDPDLWDTDRDGLSDGDEVLLWLTDPTLADTDADGLTDRAELVDHPGLDPLDPDTDGGGTIDGDEVHACGTDPLDPRDDVDCGCC